MIEYQLIESSDPGRLTEMVNEALQSGWSLQGGVAITGSDGFYLYCQALTRRRVSKSGEQG